MSNEEKTAVCRHYEFIDNDLIGTCRYCGQKKQYSASGRPPKVLERGRINGVLTEITPPKKEVKDGNQG